MSFGSRLAAVEADKPACDASGEPEVLSVCHLASGDCWAGAEAQLASLLRALVRRPDAIIRAIFLNEGRLAEEARQCGVEVKIIPETRLGFFQILAQAAAHLQGKGVQVLHCHRYKENLLAPFLSWKCGIPAVVRSHHGLLEKLPGFPFKRPLVVLLEQVLARYFTDCVVCVSADLQARLDAALHPRRSMTIQNGLDADRVRSRLSTQEARIALGVPAESAVLGTVGRLEPVKRLDLFLSAAKQLAATSPSMYFLIVGEGSRIRGLQQQAAASGLADRVLFLGHRDDVFDILRAMDIFVLCSDHEGMPMALLEALALGVPTLSRSVGGVSEVITNGVNGVLIQSDDPSQLAESCRRLLADEGERRRLADAGKLAVQRFSSDLTAAQCCQLYRSLVQSKAGTR